MIGILQVRIITMGVWQEISITFDHRIWRIEQWEIYLIFYVSLTESVQQYLKVQSVLEMKKSEKGFDAHEQRQIQERQEKYIETNG
jgi:hypothetical protein